jgi:flagellar hook-associated protein 2
MPGFYSIDGLMSNLDTTSIINAIIESESGMVNHLRLRQAETTNIVTTYKSISTFMLALKSSVSPMKNRSTFGLYSLSVSDENALSATATSSASPGTYSIGIDVLARNHQIASQGFADADSTSIGSGTVQLSVGDGSMTTLTIDSNNDTLTGLKNAINDAKIGITATIVDDGTSENPYRLVLTADKTGKNNAINITTNLNGGTAPDFATAAFDAVETDGLTAQSTSVVSKGATAAYSGNQNKTYTFTVAGTGVQTVGDGDITINWTDGTDTGVIVVSEADTEVALTGTGADGLKLSFGAGDLKAGDSFMVQGFAPTLQVAADARVSLGSTTGGGSPIVISSETNQVDDLIAGVTLNLKDVSTAPVTIEVAVDKQGIKDNITNLLDKYNEVMRQIDNQFSYNEETGEAGLLLGDGYLMAMQSSLRSALSGSLTTLPASMNMLAAIGVRTGDSGLLMLTETSTLFDAIDKDLEAVIDLFTNSGTSSNPLVQFLSATSATKTTSDGYEVNITQAAAKGYLQGTEIYDPASQSITIDSTNSALKITVDGVTSETITLTEKTYATAAQLVNELQNKIDADDNIGKYGLTAEWVSTGSSTGFLKLVSPSYGETSKVSLDLGLANNAYQVLGLTAAQSVAGKNVAGTINGESATGAGQVLTGNKGNANTEGLKLLVNLTAADLVQDPEATITYSEGFAARLDHVLESMTDSIDGSVSRRTKALEDQADYYEDQIEDQLERLEVRREKLYQRFYELEKALSQIQSEGQFFSAQLPQAPSLWGS